MDFDAFKLPSAYPVMGKTLLWVQTGAALEIIHAMTGLVRAPLFTTIIQVFSRLAVTWGLLELTPVTQTSSAVTCVFFAWSTVEVVRYAFYALNLMGIHQHAVTWCRYTLFYVLYPLGVASEMTLLYRGWQARGETPVGYMYLAFLALWGPGFIKMYTHMMVQRRKVIPSRRIHTAVKDQ
ncbi:hypothetical protein CXG81DRAFT_15914 [Caulochytrium protostelioides]|uniref:Very-long-chain (3R)-3-hydroxyacyl-CoA dehydratase n=1 Tax=Caulochytrium protostelioides TaxID=1555241 RepID=A0A4P9WX39_9FUNG|nr:protein-tyrosine phosphatase-like protein [Caulochytrium protostelioides]RKO98449.1 hypothetical protein CXG81DRAFT_15914 [Caulochytrium protostelioides]|eukprot:RKO98449.1 hypothetical protein CXG81DRAFT_15914 [Caulochytrium protostelioides]